MGYTPFEIIDCRKYNWHNSYVKMMFFEEGECYDEGSNWYITAYAVNAIPFGKRKSEYLVIPDWFFARRSFRKMVAKYIKLESTGKLYQQKHVIF